MDENETNKIMIESKREGRGAGSQLAIGGWTEIEKCKKKF